MKIETICKRTKHLRMAEMPMKARVILRSMTNNPHFPDAGPMLARLDAARAAMEAANVACLNGGRMATATRRRCRQELEQAFDSLLSYVKYSSRGDVSVALSSGFQLRKPPLLLPPLDRPSKLTARRTAHQGQVLLRWAPMHGVRNFCVLMSEGMPGESDDWISVGNTSRAKLKVNGLTSGNYYRFKVIAYSAAGASPESQVVCSIAA